MRLHHFSRVMKCTHLLDSIVPQFSRMEEAFVKLQQQYGKWVAPTCKAVLRPAVPGVKKQRPTHFLSLRLKCPNLWEHAGIFVSFFMTA